MSKTMRRVPQNWQHPKHEGRFVPLYGNFIKALTEYDDDFILWERDLERDYHKKIIEPLAEYKKNMTYQEYCGDRPQPNDYMPVWSEDICTHYQMYENVSEGTPTSPVMETPEKLAQWLADNKISSFADRTATYEQWLKMITGSGSAVSAVVKNGNIISGVEND